MTAAQRSDAAKTTGVKARPGLDVLGYADHTLTQLYMKPPSVLRGELLRDVVA